MPLDTQREAMMTRPPTYAKAFCGLLLMFLFLQNAEAGTGGSSEFGSIYTLLTGWLQGMLGRILAVTFLMVGLVSGVMRGSMMGLVLGIACGLGVYTAPTVINNIVTGTINLQRIDASQTDPKPRFVPERDTFVGSP